MPSPEGKDHRHLPVTVRGPCRPQGRLPKASAPEAGTTHALERLCDRLPQLIPAMPAVLTHGDLWAGNLLSRDGRITVIDPVGLDYSIWPGRTSRWDHR